MSDSLILFIFLNLFVGFNYANDEITQFNELLNKEKYIAALFTKKCCDCVLCVEAEALLATTHFEILENFNTIIVKLTNQNKLAREYGVKDLPGLVYLRDKDPILYEGKYEKEELFDWFGASQEVTLKTLNDDSFEHLTQAATGATTGDWLVLFYEENCDIPTTNLFAIMDTVALKSKGKKNVARVDTKLSPNLKDRFNIKTCPTILYFRLGKMYKYEVPTVSVTSITSFVDGFYSNYKGTPVPKIKTPFDKLVEFSALYIKDNQTKAAGIGAAVILIAILALWFSSKSNNSSPKEKKQ